MAQPRDDAAAARLAMLPDNASILGESEFTSPRGNKYRIIKTSELDPYERPLAAEEIVSEGVARLTPGDDFSGTKRHDAKLSIVNAPIERFDDLQKLIGSLSPDSKMIAHQPPLTEDPHFQRVAEEQRNVHVRAFLYAASREPDNDFHFIVGRDPKLAAAFMNMELSGLPPTTSPAFARLNAARSAYKTFVRNQLPGPGYQHYDPPILIDVEGSLFFDMTHAKGPHPGPAKIRPKTIWEVHPISHIVFEP